MSKKQQIRIKIISLLNELPIPAERIEIVERIGKRLRQANSKAGSLMPGDLVFCAASGVAGKITHVGIYLNDRQFAHASSKRGVTLNSIDDKYYTKRFVTARRLF